MAPGSDHVANTADLRRHLGRILAVPREVCPAIHRDDEMLTYPMRVLGRTASEAVVEYFQVGDATRTMLTQVLEWLGTDWRHGRVLDFASGFGRVSRFLVASGCEQVTVSDILAPAVEFQEQVLGVQGFVSASRPDRVQLGGPYDFISVISLFSHLPAATFTAWLGRLAGALAPGGAMLFTTHGESAYAQASGGKLAADDFVFHRASESKQLATKQYGTSFVHALRVQQFVAELPGVSLLASVPHGLNEHQDVFVVGRQRAGPKQSLQLSPVPRVFVDVVDRASDGSLRVAGWALGGSANEPVRGVAVFAGDQLMGRATMLLPRPDLVPVFRSERAAAGGWQCNAMMPGGAAGWLIALAEDVHGRRGFCCRSLAT